MASSFGSKARRALLVALLITAGCKAKAERLPPPQPFVTSGSAAGGGGAGGSGGGSTSGGGTTTTTGTPPNTCECAYSLVFDIDCGTCVNDAVSGSCSAKKAECTGDDGCAALITCPTDCLGMPESERAACVQACYVPFPEDTAHLLFLDYITCVCAECGSDCGTAEPISCQ